MKDWKVAIEIDFRKVLAVAGMVLSVWLASICGEGETLLIIIPAGLAYLFGKERDNEQSV